MLAAYDASLDKLAELGAEIVDVPLPFRFLDLVRAGAIMQAEAYYFNRALADDAGTPLGDPVRARLLGGAALTAQDYFATDRYRQDMKRNFAVAMEGIDALLTPTTETAAVPVAEVDELHLPSRFTRFGNLLDLCALSLPNGAGAGGLPLSLQIVCRGYDEATALRVGHAYQGATDWHERVPTGVQAPS